MTYLLDSNVCSEFIRGNPIVSHRFRVHFPQIAISAVSVAELFVCGFRAKSSARWLPLIRSFLIRIPVIDVDSSIAEKIGLLRAQSLDQGRPLPLPDLMIAATALMEQATLVTHNIRDFSAIPGLQLQDWQQPSP